MATFLQLCQKVARESGTVSGVYPTAVTGQTGRLLKIVNWTADAWVLIQDLRNDWNWMRAEFSGIATAGSARYTAASWNLSRFRRWVNEPGGISLYRQSKGTADEVAITETDWQTWRRTYGRGPQTPNRPVEYAISPAREFCLGPVPDATYVVRGEYVRSAQTLSANEDVPECPAEFHDIIVWRALMLLAEHDEAPLPIGSARAKYLELLAGLERDQLPEVTFGGSLA